MGRQTARKFISECSIVKHRGPAWSCVTFSSGRRSLLILYSCPTFPTPSANSSAAAGPSRRCAAGRCATKSRANVLRMIQSGEDLFPGIVGYEDTIEPQLINALLARHPIILLGLRGQAKSRILRQLTRFLDEGIPIIEGSEVNDDPFAPISKFARERIAQCGDATPIDWLHRDNRYVEKLATPDVTIADIIGDVDPIKAARGGHLSGRRAQHALRSAASVRIVASSQSTSCRILSGKIQVGLFNIMQEGDVQIKGYPVRLPLDVMLAFTANPEDYTARGKIITPLKDRIGSEITTHYPRSVELGMAITAQEAWSERGRLAAGSSRLRARADRTRRVRRPRRQAGGQALRSEPAAADQPAGARDLQCRSAAHSPTASRG